MDALLERLSITNKLLQKKKPLHAHARTPFTVSCNTENVWNDSCPATTKCVELNDDPTRHDGLCKCMHDFQFNPAFTTNDTYCIEQPDPPIQRTDRTDTNTRSTSTSKKDTDTTVAGESTAASEQYQQTPRKKPSPHHVMAGILIPIGMVFIVVASVFAYKRLHITQRIRNIRRTRRSRPFYEDVMLGSNDTDDPPLI